MRLNRDEIKKRILEEKLIENYTDLKTQLQPAGFDLCVNGVYTYHGRPRIDFDNTDRILSEIQPVPISYLDSQKYWCLSEGTYLIMFREIVNVPLDLFMETNQRSTCLRNDCKIGYGYWDPGYSGSGITRLEVGKEGLDLKVCGRIAQAIFTRVNPPKNGYDGDYQHENVER